MIPNERRTMSNHSVSQDTANRTSLALEFDGSTGSLDPEVGVTLIGSVDDVNRNLGYLSYRGAKNAYGYDHMQITGYLCGIYTYRYNPLNYDVFGYF